MGFRFRGLNRGVALKNGKHVVTAAYDRADAATLLNPAMLDCFSKMLNTIGSLCTSSELVHCLIATMETTTYECKPCSLDESRTLPSPCTVAKKNEDEECEKTKSRADCTPCQNPAPNVSICYDPGIDFVKLHCGPRAPNPDALALLLIHEASHGCVGPHLRKELIVNDIKCDNCTRPDAFEVEDTFAACNGLKPVPRFKPARR